MSLALLFPGQGVQAAGMLPWLEREPGAAPVLAILASHLGTDWRARLADEAWASSNQVAQPLMTGVALAAWGALESRLPGPSMVAGYSVGELAAYSVAGLFDAATALELARHRAELMDASSVAEPGGLLAVRGLAPATVAQIGAPIGVSIAIEADIDRCIVGGTLGALAAAADALRAAGAEVTPLRVRVASHTAAMARAAFEFARILEPMRWSQSQSLVICDLDGVGRRDGAQLKHALAAQIDHPVQWHRCMTTLGERRPRCVLEVGPGTTLVRRVESSFPDVAVRSVEQFQSAQAIVDWVRRALATDEAG